MTVNRVSRQDHWMHMWQSYMDFLTVNHRRPSKYKGEERGLVNWLKHVRKLRNQGRLPEERQEALARLLSEAARYQRINQHMSVAEKETRILQKAVMPQEPDLFDGMTDATDDGEPAKTNRDMQNTLVTAAKEE